MTNIEFIKWTVYNGGDCSLSDTEISNLIQALGVNRTIAWIASVEKNRLAKNPNSINDGAVSMSWSDRLKAFDDIISKAEAGEFEPPEGENKPDVGFQCLEI